MKRVLVVAFLVCILLTPSYGMPPKTPAWLERAREKDRDLADAFRDARKNPPTWEEYEGRTYTEINEASKKHLHDVRASFDGEKRDLVVSRLKAAFTSSPPDWEIVGLGLKTAYFTNPVPEVLQIAEQILATPPAVEFGDVLMADSMLLLVTSGQKRHYELVFNCLNDDQYLHSQPFRIATVALGVVGALKTLPPVEAHLYLAKLAQKYPFDPKVSGAWREDMPEREISSVVAFTLSYIDAVLSGETINLGNTRP